VGDILKPAAGKPRRAPEGLPIGGRGIRRTSKKRPRRWDRQPAGPAGPGHRAEGSRTMRFPAPSTTRYPPALRPPSAPTT